MSVKYKLVIKKNLGKDKEEVPEKKYAQIVSGDLVEFPELIEEISDSSGVGSAGVKAVLDRLNVVLVRHLQHGRRVSVGELGLFRYTIGSPGVTDEKTFDTNLIREPKVRFSPGKALRTIKSQASFEKLAEKKDEAGSEGEDDRPVIE
ncbi:MAG: HU family DNA-binding protein [Parabacteroides gordonii]|uniref:HU family DNA-binding protein n=1 Tax=Parabacteroides gordonii TaxID=574930 RepID=UPI003A891DBC